MNFVNLNTLTLCLSICNRIAPPTQHPLYPILEVEYDDQHREHILSDNGAEVVLPPLRPRTHTRAHQWDERYAPYIRRAGFLELVRVVNHGLPPLDPALLTQLKIGASAFFVRKLSCNKVEATNSHSILITGGGLRPTHSTYLMAR